MGPTRQRLKDVNHDVRMMHAHYEEINLNRPVLLGKKLYHTGKLFFYKKNYRVARIFSWWFNYYYLITSEAKKAVPCAAADDLGGGETERNYQREDAAPANSKDQSGLCRKMKSKGFLTCRKNIFEPLYQIKLTVKIIRHYYFISIKFGSFNLFPGVFFFIAVL